jgi:carbamoylphosphate synthase large subunit
MVGGSDANLENASPAQVLVTCGGGLQGLTVFKNIQALESVGSHLSDSNEENVSKYFYDHFFQSTPIRNESRYEEELLSYIEKHRIELIVPATQFDLKFLSDRKTEILQRFKCKVAVPERGFLDICLDKKKSHRFLAERGFPVQSEKDPVNGRNFPLIGKPFNGWGGKGIVVIQNHQGFIKGNYPVGEYFWTTYLEGFKEYSVDFSVNHKGMVSLPLARERMSVSGGMALISKSVELPALFAGLIKTHFGNPALSGIYNLQYVSCSEGLYVTDLNPRIGTSAVLGKRMAYNPIAHLLEWPADEQRVQEPVKVVRYLEEQYLVEGDEGNIAEKLNSMQNYSIVEAARREGRDENKKVIAKEMKKDGFSVSQITRYTGLKEQEIADL